MFSNEKVLVDRLEEEEEKKEVSEGVEIKISSENKRADSKWKNKCITIWKQGEARQLSLQEKVVGPENFKAVMKLGQGSFGIVYLVEKIQIDPATQQAMPTNKFYAMKILNKKQILGQNLVKYAKTERDVLTYTKHPFAVGLKYAF